MAKFSAGEVSGGSPVVQRPVCRDAAGRELKPRHPTDGVKSMSVAAETDRAVSIASGTPSYQVIRRNGAVTSFDASKIAVAMTKAFLAVEGNTAAGSRRVHDIVVRSHGPGGDGSGAACRAAAPSISRMSRTRSNSR